MQINLEQIADMITRLEAKSEARAIELQRSISDVQATASRLQFQFAALHKDIHNGKGLGARLRKIEKMPDELREEITEIKQVVEEMRHIAGGCA